MKTMAVKILIVADKNSEEFTLVKNNVDANSSLEQVDTKEGIFTACQKEDYSLIIIKSQTPVLRDSEVKKCMEQWNLWKKTPVLFFCIEENIDQLLKDWDFVDIHDLIVSPVNQHIFRQKMKNLMALSSNIKSAEHCENELSELKAKLNECTENFAQFIYIVSHDLQEPLRMVSSYTQLLERRYHDKLDQDANDFIDFAVDGANRLKRMLDDLLLYSRIGTRGSAFEPVDLNFAVSQAIKNLEKPIRDTHAIVAHDNMPLLMGDKVQLIQVFQNIISNAIKFRSAAKPEIQIKVVERENDWLFSLKDNGIGFDSEHKERIFIPFQKLHGRDKYSGTGMGLAICKRIIRKHGGSIYSESTPEKGSTFYFSLPNENLYF